LFFAFFPSATSHLPACHPELVEGCRRSPVIPPLSFRT
jgi:hypothetical protein